MEKWPHSFKCIQGHGATNQWYTNDRVPKQCHVPEVCHTTKKKKKFLDTFLHLSMCVYIEWLLNKFQSTIHVCLFSDMLKKFWKGKTKKIQMMFLIIKHFQTEKDLQKTALKKDLVEQLEASRGDFFLFLFTWLLLFRCK